MKYIRTKDMILTSEEYDEYFSAIEIIKKGDTIEELCDEFVVEYQTKKKNIFHLFNEAHDEYIRCPIDMGGFSLYGAIWTDKGLIYVAKMNEKGELELL